MRNALAADKNWKHATFVVDVVPMTGIENFRDDLESVLAANHWRQMQAASLAFLPVNTSPSMAKPACALDGLSLAVNDADYGAPNRDKDKDKDAFICEAVRSRRNYGRDSKQTFYKSIIKRVAKRDASRTDNLEELAETLCNFAGDFETIATKRGGLLNGKLAVFYADGNNFGKKQTIHCTGPEHQIAFDEFLRFRREVFLTDFLQTEASKDEWKTKVREKGADVEVIRFETLLWGGDELMFVMPAALGWRFATFFFEELGGLNLNQAKLPDGKPLATDEPLTHAAALVFCQHHAPIDRIKHLAKDQMAEFAKRTDRTRDSLVAVALESFDHLGSGFEDGMDKRYNRPFPVKKIIIPLEQIILKGTGEKILAVSLLEIATQVTTLRQSESFARSQLRGLVNEMLDKRTKAEADKLAKFDQDKKGVWQPPRNFRNASADEKKLLREQLLPLFSGHAATLWVQLEELWDYALL